MSNMQHEIKDLIWSTMSPILKDMMGDLTDVWSERNKILLHRENGVLMGAVFSHEIDQETIELEGVYMRPETKSKMAFLRLFKKATAGYKKILTTTQKVNYVLREHLLGAGFREIANDLVNVTYLKERKCLQSL